MILAKSITQSGTFKYHFWVRAKRGGVAFARSSLTPSHLEPDETELGDPLFDVIAYLN